MKVRQLQERKEVADERELSVTDDPQVGDDDDRLKLATFSNQRVRKSGSPSSMFQSSLTIIRYKTLYWQTQVTYYMTYE